MIANMLIIDVPKIATSLLSAKGVSFIYKQRIIISLTILLIVISGSISILYLLILNKEAIVLSYLAMLIMLSLILFCSCYLINTLKRRNKAHYMKVDENGIAYSVINKLGQYSDIYINWQNIAPGLVDIFYSMGNPYLQFYTRQDDGQLHYTNLPLAYFMRFTNSQQLMKAFIINLIHIDRNIIFSEKLFDLLNLDPHSMLNLSTTESPFKRQPIIQPHNYKRHIINSIVIIILSGLIVMLIHWLIALQLNNLTFTFLLLLILICSLSIITPFANLITKQTTIYSQCNHVYYRLTKQG